jgi:hypothetical protein
MEVFDPEESILVDIPQGVPPPLKKLRERLIDLFLTQQASAHNYLSFQEVAKRWAYRRPGEIPKEKEGAFRDLMEAAQDGHFPSLFWLDQRVSVERLPCFHPETVANEIRASGEEIDLGTEDENTALMTPEKIELTRSSLLLYPDRDRYLAEMFRDCLWAPREDVEKFLQLRGVALDLPPLSGQIQRENDPLGPADTEKRAQQARPDFKQIKEAYSLRVKDCQDKGIQPSRHDDEKWFKGKFGVKRDEARDIRRELAPADWQDPGRPTT